jgi:hypothetical protein
MDIARRFATTVEALQVLNDVIAPNLIRIGDLLAVPEQGSTVEIVDPAQTLRDLARRYDQDPDLLGAYNRVPRDRLDEPVGRRAILVPARSPEPVLAAP